MTDALTTGNTVFVYRFMQEAGTALPWRHQQLRLSSTEGAARGDTAYLLATETNRVSIATALAQADAGDFWTGDLEALAAELGVELEPDDK